MPDSLPDKPVSQAFQPPTTSDLEGKPSSEEQPTVPPKPPVSPSIPLTPPAEPPTSPPISPTPPSMPPTEEPGLPTREPKKQAGSQKAKIVGAVLGLLFLVVALPVTIYLIQQRQYIWPRAVYPSPSPSVPPDCQVTKDYSGATTPGYDCKKGKSASVSLKACLPGGCPATDVDYYKTEAYCDGEDWLHCEDACGADAQKGTIHLESGECKDVSASCSPHNLCGTCQVDIDGYGVRRWHDEGCPGASPEPSPSPEYEATCEDCLIYDEDWNKITDLSTIKVGQKVYFATFGSTDHPQGITKAQFRIIIDGIAGAWQETTDQTPATAEVESKFYIQYTIPSAGDYKVESMVYNPVLGWK